MASGFFAILDDIAAMMDDVAINAKLATQKTAGILGDDLAVNAEKSTGFISSREIPVLWEITKGSFLNKIIIVPVILFLNILLPAAIIVILVLGGFYLAYEGVEKVIEYIFHKNKPVEQPTLSTSKVDPNEEKIKIKSAITTDFILSVEIVIIALSTVINSSLIIQILTLSAVSIIATVGVYGIVALVVRMDDLGFMLIVKSNSQGFFNTIGQLLVKTLPIVIKIFSVVGSLALLLVAGGIFSHNIEYLHHILPEWPSIIKEFVFGVVVGIIVFVIIGGIKNMIKLVKTKN
jgi:predicted DNA repair protein MutK